MNSNIITSNNSIMRTKYGDIVKAYKLALYAEKWAKKVNDDIFNALSEGYIIPGLELKAGRARPLSWSEEKISKLSEEAKDMICEKKMMSPSQVERSLKQDLEKSGLWDDVAAAMKKNPPNMKISLTVTSDNSMFSSID